MIHHIHSYLTGSEVGGICPYRYREHLEEHLPNFLHMPLRNLVLHTGSNRMHLQDGEINWEHESIQFWKEYLKTPDEALHLAVCFSFQAFCLAYTGENIMYALEQKRTGQDDVPALLRQFFKGESYPVSHAQAVAFTPEFWARRGLSSGWRLEQGLSHWDGRQAVDHLVLFDANNNPRVIATQAHPDYTQAFLNNACRH